jgi:hypothetical protein
MQLVLRDLGMHTQPMHVEQAILMFCIGKSWSGIYCYVQATAAYYNPEIAVTGPRGRSTVSRCSCAFADCWKLGRFIRPELMGRVYNRTVWDCGCTHDACEESINHLSHRLNQPTGRAAAGAAAQCRMHMHCVST